MGKTAVIIGGAGRLGKSLVSILLDRGHRIKVFDLPTADFSGLEHIDKFEGSIDDIASLTSVIEDADVVVHLAALLPPKSEANRDQTWKINVGGTQNIIRVISSVNPSSQLIFSSSVTTYGDSSQVAFPVKVDFPQHALDIYAETKIASEKLIKASSLPWAILRIAGIAVPEFLEPPGVWPFQKEQRVEFVNCYDAALAIANCMGNDFAERKIFNISGGSQWQMLGWQYVQGYYDIYDNPMSTAKYQDGPGWPNWYDTDESQQLLKFQHTSWQEFLRQLGRATAEAMG